MKKIFLVLVFLIIGWTSFGQQFRPYNTIQIYEKLKQLNHLTTVMYLAAHPDDENTRLLSYLAHERNFKTVYLSLTRGDGGQNLIGTELGIELGLIRNYELIEARKIDGAEQAFTSVIDFGYTKNPGETFEFWNRQALTDEVKEAIKIYRPDIIICRFPTTGEGGHGQHTASAMVAIDAYNQLKKDGYSFLPERVVFNAFRFGDRNTIKPSMTKIETNQYNYLLGESYGEMAGRSRSIHRSQGAGTPQSYGRSDEHFELLAGDAMNRDFVDKDYSWNRVAAPQITTAVRNIINKYDFENPTVILPDLLQVRMEITKVKDEYWRNLKLQEIDAIILSVAGVMGECFYNKPEVVNASKFDLTFKMIARSNSVVLKSVVFPGATNAVINNVVLENDKSFEQSLQLQLKDKLPITEPYWLASHPTLTNYQYEKFHTLPETPNHFVAEAEVSINGIILKLNIPISYKYLSPTKGDVVQALRVVPEVFIRPAESLQFYNLAQDLKMKVWLQTNAANIQKGKLKIFDLNKGGSQILIKEIAVSLPNIGKDSLYTIDLSKEELTKIKSNEVLLVFTDDSGQSYFKAQRKINYDHLPELVYYPEARLKMTAETWKPVTTKVGYINGAGDKVFDLLKQIGVDIEIIPNELIHIQSILSKYDAVVVGVRAYNANEVFAKNKDAMMQYVANGGNLIVQYNTSMNLLTKDYGPYPFTIGRDRVTDENAKITVTNPSSPILNTPNKISENDYRDWVQERGLYFSENLDKQYQTLFTMHDKGEQPLTTGLFYGKYGKGYYIYTSLSFFRQLPAGNEGAIKLFLNMISL